MMAEAPVMDNEVFNNYLTGMTPAEFAEHLKDSCPEFGDLNVQELLLVQESAFQFIQNKNQNKDTASSYGETSDHNLVLEHENELPHGGIIMQMMKKLLVFQPISTPIPFTSPTINNIIHIYQLSESTTAPTKFSPIATIPCITPMPY